MGQIQWQAFVVRPLASPYSPSLAVVVICKALAVPSNNPFNPTRLRSAT
jgi:hypothetical protein